MKTQVLSKHLERIDSTVTNSVHRVRKMEHYINPDGTLSLLTDPVEQQESNLNFYER